MRSNTTRSTSSYLLFLFLCTLLASCTKHQENKPNIIFILADDLGYGEIGAYGQSKIETPNLDALADSGMKFTNFYTGAPVCAPSRCIFLTGMHSGHADIRGNDELGSRGDVWSYRAMAANPGLEGQIPMSDSVITIAELLQKNGYHTAMFGKWGLGYPGSESTPNKQGFDYFFGYNCQRQAHNLRPLFLYRNESRVLLANDTIPPGTKLAPGVDSLSADSYLPYSTGDYAPELIFQDLQNFLKRSREKPFFIYWASPVPHLPLQAPQKWIDHYVNKFGDEKPYTGNKGYFPARYPRASYAAMISYLDENIGKLIEQLKAMNQLENTVIVFSSDNGPSYTGGTDSPWFQSGGPFRSDYGWGKGFLREAGIRVPLLVSWPGHVAPGSSSNRLSAMQDLFPSFAEIADIRHENNVDGISLCDTWKGKTAGKNERYLYWEFPEYGGQRALRWKNWKAYNRDLMKGNMKIELYNLESDLNESLDLSSEYPNLINWVDSIFSKEHQISRNSKWQYPVLDNLISN